MKANRNQNKKVNDFREGVILRKNKRNCNWAKIQLGPAQESKLIQALH